MFDKEFSAITAADLQSLVTNQVQEDRRLDYKEQCSIQNDSDKKEFLADVSAFANANGGHIIFGIQEQRDSNNKPTGVSSAVVGLANFNVDAEILRLETIIREGLAPRLSGVLMRKVDGFSQGPVLLVRIPQSWSAPHMVIFQSRPAFYSRGNAGKFPMDITQIRSAFVFSESLSDKIRNFHQDRVAKILGGSTPTPLNEGRRLIFHVIPLAAFRGDISVDVPAIKSRETHLAPISSHGFNTRINLEGFLIYAAVTNGQPSYSYAQFYRNGIIELVDTLVLGREQVPTVDFEQHSIEGMNRYFKYLLDVGIPGPVVILTALAGVNGVRLGVHNRQFDMPGLPPKQFDRNLVTLPEVIVDDLSTPADIAMKPIFDAAYNAAGWNKCEHYDASGRWQFPR